MKDKTLPLIGRIDIRIMEEQQARVLGFLNGEFDLLEPLPAPLADMALDHGTLKPSLRARGIVLSTIRLNAILEIDVPNRRMVAQAGVVNVYLTKAVRKDNLHYVDYAVGAAILAGIGYLIIRARRRRGAGPPATETT